MQNHVQNSTTRKAGRALPFIATRTAKRAMRKIRQSARPLVRRSERTASGAFEWVKTHPKTSVGLVLGAGALYGLIGTRMGRTAILGLGAAAYALYKRLR